MATDQAVETDFDKILEEDVILEEVDGVSDTRDILAHAENLYKANLYLKRLFSGGQIFNEVLSFDTIESNEYQDLVTDGGSLVLIKNIKDENSYIKLNDGVFVLLPFESFEIPIQENQTISVKGFLTIALTKYI